jgi:hypothetical protein
MLKAFNQSRPVELIQAPCDVVRIHRRWINTQQLDEVRVAEVREIMVCHDNASYWLRRSTAGSL